MRTTLVPLALLACALVACGDKQSETSKSERFIRGVVVRQIGVQVRSVRCPDGVKATPGATFTCVVTGRDGSEGSVNVRQTAGEGIDVTAPFLHMHEVEATMQRGLSRQRETAVTVSCQEIVVVTKSALFTCEARYRGRTRIVSARMTDATGRFRYRLSAR